MPHYDELLALFIKPLLDEPERLTYDTEITRGGKRVWLRMSFSERDKGRVFGRGGRTLQAIRQVLGTAAQLAGQDLVLQIHESGGRRSGR